MHRRRSRHYHFDPFWQFGFFFFVVFGPSLTLFPLAETEHLGFPFTRCRSEAQFANFKKSSEPRHRRRLSMMQKKENDIRKRTDRSGGTGLWTSGGNFFFLAKKTDGIEQNSSKTFEASLGVPES
jgi:hypothetical protein